ncbi:immunity protein Imm33 domain-containing protein [Sporosarcina limicola]|uniref:DUF2185 domain-containing protein n=1 Tax=Sporosarcina limicola TaxID=34101 RepID=A0A927RDT8_9BACL|nr:DUF2185 domain-containing protein [Sporosarcina limicola]MBE1555660.1 hypothetical protein [Sporosarcina limicola]
MKDSLETVEMGMEMDNNSHAQNGKSSELYAQVERFHQDDEHQQIIELIHQIEGYEKDYELIGLLARAHNNLDEYSEAIALLEGVAPEGENDSLWHYRLGYAYYYDTDDEELMRRALNHFEKAYKLGDEESLGMLAMVKSGLELELSEAEDAALIALVGEYDQEVYEPLVYSEEEMQAIEEHTTKWFGEHKNVFHELVSPDLHIDLLIIEPRPEHDYYTIVTMGAGMHQMNIPDGYEGPKRAEFLINLPKDWDVHSEDEKDYWPLRWLKILSRFSLQQDTWLGWGHTIPAGEPFAENTLLNSIMLSVPLNFEEESLVSALPNGDQVVFWQVVPLYEEEVQYKLRNGVEALEEEFDCFPSVLDITRPCVVSLNPQKDFALQPEQIEELFSWDEPMGCFATDGILVDGKKVGYMYREEPDLDKEEYDSGWRFVAGDEDDEYMDNEENLGVYSLNTIANYDRDIIPFLKESYPTTFARDENGKFIRVETRE